MPIPNATAFPPDFLASFAAFFWAAFSAFNFRFASALARCSGVRWLSSTSGFMCGFLPSLSFLSSSSSSPPAPPPLAPPPAAAAAAASSVARNSALATNSAFSEAAALHATQ